MFRKVVCILWLSATWLAGPGGAAAQDGETSAQPESQLTASESPDHLVPAQDNADEELSRAGADSSTLLPLPLRVGLRAGYALPFGSLREGSALSDAVRSMIPITIDAMVVLSKRIGIGLYLQFAAGQGSEATDRTCADCALLGYRLGIAADWHMNAGAAVDPWFGVELGYEWLSFSGDGSTEGVSFQTTYKALPELALQAGIEFGNEQLRAGPYVSLAAATYSSVESKVNGCSALVCPVWISTSNLDSSDRTFHGWLTVGVRGAYVL